jgi:hypothetical protein
VLFAEQTAAAIAEAVGRFAAMAFDGDACRAAAAGFGAARFRGQLLAAASADGGA